MGLFSSRTPSDARPAARTVTTDDAVRGAPLRALWNDSIGLIATRSIQTLAVLALLAVAAILLTQVSLVVVPLLVALVLAAAISPLVTWLRQRGLPSIVATWLALLALAAAFAAIIWAVVLAVVDQWPSLQESALDGLERLQSYVTGLPFEITEEQIASVQDTLTSFLTSASVGSGALAGVSATTNFVAGFFLVLVMLFFFLKDGPKIWEFLLRPFEGEAYERGRRVGKRTIETLGGYVRGTAIVAAVDAVGIGLGLVIMGVPLAIPLSVLVFLLAFIPLVGATLAGILAALVTLVANGPVDAIIVIVIVIAVNQIEGDFLQPVVMGRSLRLHPLVILVALTIGTVTVGITGAVLAVPIAASIWGAIKVWDGLDTPARWARIKRPEVV